MTPRAPTPTATVASGSAPYAVNQARKSLLANSVRRLNERGLALLSLAAQKQICTDSQVRCKAILPFIALLNPDALARAANCPMVLLDFNFQRLECWTRTLESRLFEKSIGVAQGPLLSDEAFPLARDLLVEAWSAARSMPSVSSLVFGMSPEVTALIAGLTPRELDGIASTEIAWLAPRWMNRPTFWKRLFEAANQADDQLLHNVYLHSLQLLGGELSSMSAKPTNPRVIASAVSA